jgi:hypothetical protein
VNVTVMRYGLAGPDAARRMEDAAERLQRDLGPPDVTKGDADGTYLASAAFATAHVAYRYKDYLAEVTATNMPGHGVAVREHYMSARD